MDTGPARRRLEPDQRRAQLLQAGLGLVKRVPWDQVSAEEVARAADVSKALVFHYFPSTHDLHLALLRAAAEELLDRLVFDPAEPAETQLRAGIESFLDYVEQQPVSYLAVTRGAGSDEGLRAVFEETREAIVDKILAALAMPEAPPGLRLAIRGYIAMAEEMILRWLVEAHVSRIELVDFLEEVAFTTLPIALRLGRAARRGARS